VSRVALVFVLTWALGGCLQFAPPPEPIGQDTSAPLSCDAGCAVSDRCLAAGEQAPELAPCQVCGPEQDMLGCPFGCDGDRCAAVVELDAGDLHACVSLDTGAVWCWGARDAGAVGDGVLAVDETPPVAAAWTGPTDALEVGFDFTCVLSDGDVYCWGGNAYGQAGRPPSPAEPTPARVDLPGDAEALARVDGKTPCAVLEDGDVWCWGFVLDGRGWEGGGDGAGSETPVQVALDQGVGAPVATGRATACAISADRGLSCWGDGGFGALGIGTTEDHEAPQPVTALSEEELAVISVGDRSACALNQRGEAWCWGQNAAGQLGRPETEGDWRATPLGLLDPPMEALQDVRQGFRHTCALGASDRVFCWGLRTQGQCGATFLSASHHVVPLPGLPPIAAIATGGMFTCVLGRDDGFVRCFGAAGRGQLGQVGLDTPSTGLPRLVHRVQAAPATAD